MYKERIQEFMSQNQKSKTTPLQFVYRILQGALIGLGAVLPGISGGVLSVIFGIYKPIMELLSNPFANFKTHVPKLIPVFIGGVIGFLGGANLLSFFLDMKDIEIANLLNLHYSTIHYHRDSSLRLLKELLEGKAYGTE